MNNAAATAARGRRLAQSESLAEAGYVRLYSRPSLLRCRAFRLTICPQQSGIPNCRSNVRMPNASDFSNGLRFRLAFPVCVPTEYQLNRTRCTITCMNHFRRSKHFDEKVLHRVFFFFFFSLPLTVPTLCPIPACLPACCGPS